MKYLSGFFPILFGILSLCSFANAQTISITGPTAPVVVQEGDDFASSELGNPWDMSQRRDLGWEQGFDEPSVNVNNGVWTGANKDLGGYIFPLFPGFKGSLFAEGLEGDSSLPRFGINHRINTAKYTHLSFKLKHSSRGTFAVYWENDESRPEYWPDTASPMGASYDGYYHWSVPYLNEGWNLYQFDMTNLSSSFQQVKKSWSGSVYALRLDPSVGSAVGATTELDWIRLVDPDSAPDMTISWDSRNLSTFSVITVNVDTNNSGYDGTPIARYTTGNDPGSHTFPTATLPPGTYYFYVTAQIGSAGTLSGPVYRSGYSVALTINKKPSAFFTSPSQVTGQDYATSDVSNPWDMDATTDVPNLNPAHWPDEWRQFTQQSFASSHDAEEAGTLFQALADPPWTQIGNNESDVQVHLNVSPSKPIDPTKYRYLTYRLAVDASNYPTLHDKVSRGWVSRPVFWNSNVVTDGGRPKAHVVYEGWNTYTIDLWDSSIIEQGIPWLSFPRLEHLRIDPLETDVPTWFWLDWVKLSAENYASNDQFNIGFTLADTDNSTFSVDIYYDSDNSGFDGTRIVSFDSLSAGNHSYLWNTSGLSDGDSYYLYLVVSDGLNTSYEYSPVKVTIGDFVNDPTPRSAAPSMDYDGDGVSDHCVYRQSTGTYFQNRSTDGFWSLAWGGPGFIPIHADIDGDEKTDNGLVIELNGSYWWYITRSSDGLLYSRMWGLSGDDIVLGDYNGNGRDEIGVFRAGAWFILDESDAPVVHYWGLPGDIALPRDYDGDGKDDIAIWRPSDGMWWIINSGHQSGYADDWYSAVQWGLPGDTPVPADWTGDGRVDPAVFRASLGMWYTQDIVSGETTATQWGLPGDVPMVGDYNGDGNLDFTVYRDYIGTWFHNYRDGTTGAQQFGLPGDLLPDKAN